MITDNVQSRTLLRAETLDTIAAVLPMNRRDMLAGILTDEDVETLRHLVNEGMGENTLRALTSDLAYLEAGQWLQPAIPPLPRAGGPAPEIRCASFVAAAATRDRTRSRYASRRGRGIAPTRLSACVGSACTGNGPPTSGQLVDADPLARSGRIVFIAFCQIGHPSCGARPEPAAQPQECPCDYRRYSGQAAGDVCRRESNRFARPGYPDGSLCLRRAQAQRNSRLARRTAGQTGTGHR